MILFFQLVDRIFQYDDCLGFDFLSLNAMDKVDEVLDNMQRKVNSLNGLFSVIDFTKIFSIVLVVFRDFFDFGFDFDFTNVLRLVFFVLVDFIQLVTISEPWDLDSVRRKAYGTLEEEIESSLNRQFDEPQEAKRTLYEDVVSISCDCSLLDL